MPARPTFAPFTTPHFAAVGIALAIIVSVVAWGRKQTTEAAARAGRTLGVALLVYYALESFVRVAFLGMHFVDILPFELCNALFFIGAYAFFSGNALAFECVYFWTFAGTIHAFITPTPRAGFPDPNYFQYFAAHGLLILSASYAAFAMRRTPTRGSLLRAYLALQAFTALVAIIDLASGQNYLYLRHKPPSPTALDAFGEWPRYIVGGELVALASFTLWNLPFVIRRARTKPSALEPRLQGMR